MNGSTPIIELVLTDRGGFVNINNTFPEADLSNPQVNPDLYTRAFKAAWMTNAYTMLYLNVTNPHNDTSGEHAFSYLNSNLNKTFRIPSLGAKNNYDTLALDDRFDNHLDFTGSVTNTDPSASGRLPNPFRMTDSNFTDIGRHSRGISSMEYSY